MFFLRKSPSTTPLDEKVQQEPHHPVDEIDVRRLILNNDWFQPWLSTGATKPLAFQSTDAGPGGY